MIGDSITDCGRTQPIGEGLFEAHGKGYVALVNGILAAEYPERRIRVINMGTSGHTVRDLKARWQRDVIALKPELTPYFIEPNPLDAMRATMDRYGQVVHALAQKHAAIYVDTQAAYNKVLQHCHPAALAWDRVHPNITGHMILAQEFLKSVQYAR